MENQSSYSTGTNGRRLTIHQAQITTATIAIQTLTIGPKQITLAVFRQLIDEPLIDTMTGQFRGVPWGTVNYHPDKDCGKQGKHLHVVWQKGDELRRACVKPSPLIYNDGIDHHWAVAPALERYVIACLVAGQRPPSPVLIQTDTYYGEATALHIDVIAGNRQGQKSDLFFVEGREQWSSKRLRQAVAALANGKTQAEALASGRAGVNPHDPNADRATTTLNDARAYLAATGGEESPDAIADTINQHIHQHAAYKATINERYSELESLPQLFIAV